MIIPVFIPHRGCPHQCIFCNQKTISGEQENGLEAAKRQINKYLPWLRPDTDTDNEIAFYGGTFTALEQSEQDALLGLANEYIQQGIVQGIRISTRPDYIDATIIGYLQEHHVRTVEIGVQSADDRVLSVAQRGHTREDVVKAVTLLKRSTMQVGMQLMVGLPQQDYTSWLDTIELTLELQPDIVRIYPVLVIRNTYLAQMLQDESYVPLTVEEAVQWSEVGYRRFLQQGIQVIRMGLQPDAELCQAGNILAGPFHSSFGELVQSRYCFNNITAAMNEVTKGEEIVLVCPKKFESKVRGLKNCNYNYWHEHYSHFQLVIAGEILKLNGKEML